MTRTDWKAKAENLEKELKEAKREIRSLRLLGDVLQHAVWPHEELEITLSPGKQKAPPIVAFWREFIASRTDAERQ